jgi:hypothetical protein
MGHHFASRKGGILGAHSIVWSVNVSKLVAKYATFNVSQSYGVVGDKK